RQPDGSFTAKGFSIPAGSSNAVGTKLGTLAQAQAYFSACSGIAAGSPAPHPSVLGDQLGTMARDGVTANLGGSAPYAELKIVKGALNVVLDTQDTFGSSTTAYKTNDQGTPS